MVILFYMSVSYCIVVLCIVVEIELFDNFVKKKKKNMRSEANLYLDFGQPYLSEGNLT